MRLKLYRAPSMQGAMAQVRAELGPEAIILATRRAAGGIEITAALEETSAAPAPPLSRGPGSALAWHGVPEHLEAGLAGPLAPALAAAFRFGPIPLGARALLIVGAPGSGKTLTTARLATRAVLAGQTPAVITTDTRRAGAAEELGAVTRLMNLTLTVAHDPATLSRAIARTGGACPILIDTAGANPHDAADLAALAALAAAAEAAPLLVLPSGLHPEEAAEQARAFRRIGATHLLATRLDLARRLGWLLAAASEGLILTEAGVGPGIAEGLVPLTPAFLSERLHTGAPACPQPA